MSYSLIILKSASEGITDAFDWYEMQSEFAAAYFMERLDEALGIIVSNPLIYQKVTGIFDKWF